MQHLHFLRWIGPFVLALIWSNLAQAEPEALCDQAARSAAQRFGVPENVLRAMTRVETGQMQEGRLQPWPWSVNAAGTGHWFNSATEAQQFVEAALGNGDQNMDIGCFQVNLRWHAAGFASLEDMFDPQTNANYAAQFLTDLFDQKGNWVDAVAAYHSRTPEHAEAYLSKVESVLISLTDEVTLPALLPEPRANLLPLLQAGSPRGNGSLFVSNAQNAPLIGGGS